jgi:hypothetical protein
MQTVLYFLYGVRQKFHVQETHVKAKHIDKIFRIFPPIYLGFKIASLGVCLQEERTNELPIILSNKLASEFQWPRRRRRAPS